MDSSKANVQIEKWNAEEKELQVTSKQPVRVGLRLLNCPAWRAEVNGKLAKTELSNPMNQIILPVPEGRSEIRVRFTRTADRILGWVLSVACMLAVAATLVFAWLAKRRTIWNLGGQILGQPEPIHNPGDSAAA